MCTCYMGVCIYRGGLKFEPKWFLPLCDLTFLPPEDNPEGENKYDVPSYNMGNYMVKGRHVSKYMQLLVML